MNVISLLVSLLLGSAVAGQASNFNVSQDVAAKYECGDTCYQVLQAANAEDLALLGTDFDFDFYETASNFSSSQPGDLLKLQVIDPATISDSATSGVTYYRFQYTSTSINGTKVPVTGFIAIPFAPFPDSKTYRTLAYAHGTLGIYRGCAASASPTLYDYQSWSILAQSGYAIVATDYAGLGNNYTEHKYLTMPEQANDVFYSVVAARKAFGDGLSDEWVSLGHSQGGGAVWKLSESELLRTTATAQEAGNYVGGVALAPASRIYDMTVLGIQELTKDAANIHSYDISGELAWLGISVQRLVPSYNMSIYGDTLRKRVQLASIAQTCYYGMLGFTVDLDIDQLVSSSDVTKDAGLQKFQNLTAPGAGDRADQPLLIVQGLNDTAVLPSTTIETAADSCKYGNEIQLKLYEDLDHTAVIPAAAPVFLDWINNRFLSANKTGGSRGECTTRTYKAWDPVNMKAPKEADELELS